MKSINLKTFLRVTFCMLLCAAGTSVLGQETTPATQAYLSWKQNVYTKQNLAADFQHYAVGVSVTRYLDKGVTVDFSVGISEAARLGKLSFGVQAVYVQKESKLIDDRGSISTVNMTSIAEAKPDPNGVAATPKLIIATPADANAVRVTISGLCNPDSVTTLILPIKDQATTGSIGNIDACSK